MKREGVRDRFGETQSAGRRRIDTVVIGGGQVGLTAGYHLRKRGREFVILEAGDRIGDSWRQRWDSLVLFTPAYLNRLPGMKMPQRGATYPTKDQMADYLEAYGARFAMPIHLSSPVRRLSREGDRFIVETPDATWEADHVVVAAGSRRKPRILDFADQLDPSITQLHSSEYRGPRQLEPGKVLVVGAGNSGADISMEVVKTHETIWSGKESATIPFRIDTPIARHLLARMVGFVGMRVLNSGNPLGRKARAKLITRAAPLVRVKPKDLVGRGVRRVGRVTGVDKGLPVTEDGERLDVRNVIWCTGFTPAFSWIDLPILEANGEPQHERGVVASQPGLYFAGLHFQYSAASETVPGQQPDVRYVINHLVRLSKRGRVAADSA